MQKNKLLLYGTTFNVEKYLPAVMQSLEFLKPLEYELFVVDNYSKDNTYDILKSYHFVHIIQAKCSRGKGRNLALGMLLEIAKENFPIKYMDFDNVFTPQSAEIIKRDIKNLKDNV
ncbi:MAG: glycosyltransferase family 2 protein, partial [Candidatus Marsarchaeota archaeon]|nr:glycosyltransferase family 2 protein [Candidatus Marsarchaeota archaeon]